MLPLVPNTLPEFTQTRRNDFQWKNLYMKRYGVCNYPPPIPKDPSTTTATYPTYQDWHTLMNNLTGYDNKLDHGRTMANMFASFDNSNPENSTNDSYHSSSSCINKNNNAFTRQGRMSCADEPVGMLHHGYSVTESTAASVEQQLTFDDAPSVLETSTNNSTLDLTMYEEVNELMHTRNAALLPYVNFLHRRKTIFPAPRGSIARCPDIPGVTEEFAANKPFCPVSNINSANNSAPSNNNDNNRADGIGTLPLLARTDSLRSQASGSPANGSIVGCMTSSGVRLSEEMSKLQRDAWLTLMDDRLLGWLGREVRDTGYTATQIRQRVLASMAGSGPSLARWRQKAATALTLPEKSDSCNSGAGHVDEHECARADGASQTHTENGATAGERGSLGRAHLPDVRTISGMECSIPSLQSSNDVKSNNSKKVDTSDVSSGHVTTSSALGAAPPRLTEEETMQRIFDSFMAFFAVISPPHTVQRARERHLANVRMQCSSQPMSCYNSKSRNSTNTDAVNAMVGLPLLSQFATWREAYTHRTLWRLTPFSFFLVHDASMNYAHIIAVYVLLHVMNKSAHVHTLQCLSCIQHPVMLREAPHNSSEHAGSAARTASAGGGVRSSLRQQQRGRKSSTKVVADSDAHLLQRRPQQSSIMCPLIALQQTTEDLLVVFEQGGARNALDMLLQVSDFMTECVLDPVTAARFLTRSSLSRQMHGKVVPCRGSSQTIMRGATSEELPAQCGKCNSTPQLSRQKGQTSNTNTPHHANSNNKLDNTDNKRSSNNTTNMAAEAHSPSMVLPSSSSTPVAAAKMTSHYLAEAHELHPFTEKEFNALFELSYWYLDASTANARQPVESAPPSNPQPPRHLDQLPPLLSRIANTVAASIRAENSSKKLDNESAMADFNTSVTTSNSNYTSTATATSTAYIPGKVQVCSAVSSLVEAVMRYELCLHAQITLASEPLCVGPDSCPLSKNDSPTRCSPLGCAASSCNNSSDTNNIDARNGAIRSLRLSPATTLLSTPLIIVLAYIRVHGASWLRGLLMHLFNVLRRESVLLYVNRRDLIASYESMTRGRPIASGSFSSATKTQAVVRPLRSNARKSLSASCTSSALLLSSSHTDHENRNETNEITGNNAYNENSIDAHNNSDANSDNMKSIGQAARGDSSHSPDDISVYDFCVHLEQLESFICHDIQYVLSEFVSLLHGSGALTRLPQGITALLSRFCHTVHMRVLEQYTSTSSRFATTTSDQTIANINHIDACNIDNSRNVYGRKGKNRRIKRDNCSKSSTTNNKNRSASTPRRQRRGASSDKERSSDHRVTAADTQSVEGYLKQLKQACQAGRAFRTERADEAAARRLTGNIEHHRLVKFILFDSWIIPALNNAVAAGHLAVNSPLHLRWNIDAFARYLKIMVNAPFVELDYAAMGYRPADVAHVGAEESSMDNNKIDTSSSNNSSSTNNNTKDVLLRSNNNNAVTSIAVVPGETGKRTTMQSSRVYPKSIIAHNSANTRTRPRRSTAQRSSNSNSIIVDTSLILTTGAQGVLSNSSSVTSTLASSVGRAAAGKRRGVRGRRSIGHFNPLSQSLQTSQKTLQQARSQHDIHQESAHVDDTDHAEQAAAAAAAASYESNAARAGSADIPREVDAILCLPSYIAGVYDVCGGGLIRLSLPPGMCAMRADTVRADTDGDESSSDLCVRRGQTRVRVSSSSFSRSSSSSTSQSSAFSLSLSPNAVPVVGQRRRERQSQLAHRSDNDNLHNQASATVSTRGACKDDTSEDEDDDRSYHSTFDRCRSSLSRRAFKDRRVHSLSRRTLSSQSSISSSGRISSSGSLLSSRSSSDTCSRNIANTAAEDATADSNSSRPSFVRATQPHRSGDRARAAMKRVNSSPRIPSHSRAHAAGGAPMRAMHRKSTTKNGNDDTDMNRRSAKDTTHDGGKNKHDDLPPVSAMFAGMTGATWEELSTSMHALNEGLGMVGYDPDEEDLSVAANSHRSSRVRSVSAQASVGKRSHSNKSSASTLNDSANYFASARCRAMHGLNLFCRAITAPSVREGGHNIVMEELKVPATMAASCAESIYDLMTGAHPLCAQTRTNTSSTNRYAYLGSNNDKHDCNNNNLFVRRPCSTAYLACLNGVLLHPRTASIVLDHIEHNAPSLYQTLMRPITSQTPLQLWSAVMSCLSRHSRQHPQAGAPSYNGAYDDDYDEDENDEYGAYSDDNNTTIRAAICGNTNGWLLPPAVTDGPLVDSNAMHALLGAVTALTTDSAAASDMTCHTSAASATDDTHDILVEINDKPPVNHTQTHHATSSGGNDYDDCSYNNEPCSFSQHGARTKQCQSDARWWRQQQLFLSTGAAEVSRWATRVMHKAQPPSVMLQLRKQQHEEQQQQQHIGTAVDHAHERCFEPWWRAMAVALTVKASHVCDECDEATAERFVAQARSAAALNATHQMHYRAQFVENKGKAAIPNTDVGKACTAATTAARRTRKASNARNRTEVNSRRTSNTINYRSSSAATTRALTGGGVGVSSLLVEPGDAPRRRRKPETRVAKQIDVVTAPS